MVKLFTSAEHPIMEKDVFKMLISVFKSCLKVYSNTNTLPYFNSECISSYRRFVIYSAAFSTRNTDDFVSLTYVKFFLLQCTKQNVFFQK